MADNNKNLNANPLGCPQTRGTFQLSGIVTGTAKENFYSEGTTKKNRPFRSVNFGVEIEKGKVVYLNLFGTSQDKVYFSKRDKDTKKTETQAVDWKDRFTWSREGFRMIGVNCGCTKKIDSKTGNEINDTKTLTPFDACAEVKNLKDGQSVFVRGNITYSTYNNQHRVNFEPTQVSLCRPIDFDAEDFEPNAFFTQRIIYQEVAKSADKEGEYVVSAKMVGFSSVEDAELYTTNLKMAKNFKKVLKPYTCIDVHGDIVVESNMDEVEEEDDGWGEANKMNRVNNPFVRKLMITGADKDSIDDSTYTEEIIAAAIVTANSNKRAKSEYGDNDESGSGDEWGASKSAGSYDNEDDDFDIDL